MIFSRKKFIYSYRINIGLLRDLFFVFVKKWFCRSNKLYSLQFLTIGFLTMIAFPPEGGTITPSQEQIVELQQLKNKEGENIYKNGDWKKFARRVQNGQDCSALSIGGTTTVNGVTTVSEGAYTATDIRNCDSVAAILGIEPTKEGDKSGCEAAKETFDEAKKEANTKCSKFGGIGKCFAVMRSCQDCPEEGGKRCARLPSGAKCPQFAGGDLEELKEEIEDGKTVKEELESDIKDLRDDIMEKEGELAEAKRTYEEDLNTLQSELQEANDEMEAAVKEKQTKIDDNLQKAISSVQGELSKSLKIQHAFINELAKAERTRREAKQKLYEKCRHTAGARLAAYRKYRRQAIREGRYGNTGVRKIMRKRRVSFTKQDNVRYQSYYSSCMSESAPLFASIEEDYRTTLKLIEQKKKEMLAEYKSLQAQVQQLNNQALQKKKQIIQDFAQNTSKALQKFQVGQAQRTKQYKSEEQQFHMALMGLQQQLTEKEGRLDTVNSRQGFNKRLKQSLKKKGVSSENSGEEETNVAEAQAALENFRDTVEPAYTECCEKTISLTLTSAEKEKMKKKKSEEPDAKMLRAKWESASNEDCTSFQSAFKNIYSSLRFTDYKHEVNRKKMNRKMKQKHGSH